MLRSVATRSLIKSFAKAPISRTSYSAASAKFRNATPLRQLSNKRPQVLKSFGRSTTISLLYATKSEPPYDHIDPKAEAQFAKEKIKPHPDEVSLGSSVRHVFEKGQGPKEETQSAMMQDLKTIRDTFALTEVPKESLYIGAAGVLPYAATSLSTVVLSYDINHTHATGNGYLFSPETAHQLLAWVTPIQIGYGAVIISFLGAIHWGMEYAGYGGYHSYRRYMIGVIAPAVAWPTIFMPVEYALITQFLAFNFLYFVDARATVRGWFPPWYSTYRFVLTFLVGASIVVSLVGRGQIIKADANLRDPAGYLKQDRDMQWEALEREEKERRANMVAEDEGGEGDSDESGDDGKDGEDSKSDDKKNGDKSEDKKDAKKDEKEKRSN